MIISNFVAYVKQMWKNKPDTSTPLSADRLLHIEDGIKGNSDAIEAIAAAVVSQIVNDPDKIASMAALYAVNAKIGDVANLPNSAADVVAAINQQNSNLNDVSTKISGLSVFQNTVPITVANGYGESTANVKKDGYRCLGMVGFQINSTYYFIYKSLFDITNETLIVGIRRPGDTSEGIFNVYVRCLYIPE